MTNFARDKIMNEQFNQMHKNRFKSDAFKILDDLEVNEENRKV